MMLLPRNRTGPGSESNTQEPAARAQRSGKTRNIKGKNIPSPPADFAAPADSGLFRVFQIDAGILKKPQPDFRGQIPAQKGRFVPAPEMGAQPGFRFPRRQEAPQA